jgi:hypothetical protein
LGKSLRDLEDFQLRGEACTLLLNRRPKSLDTSDLEPIFLVLLHQCIATTNFYQLGAAYNSSRFSVSADTFLIDRSNEQAYIPDDGTFEFKGPSRSYGYETKASFRINRHLAINAAVTQVTQSLLGGFRGSAAFARSQNQQLAHRQRHRGFELAHRSGRVRHPRGIALLAPIWHFLDLTPQGRANWYTGLDYGRKVYAAST